MALHLRTLKAAAEIGVGCFYSRNRRCDKSLLEIKISVFKSRRIPKKAILRLKLVRRIAPGRAIKQNSHRPNGSGRTVLQGLW